MKRIAVLALACSLAGCGSAIAPTVRFDPSVRLVAAGIPTHFTQLRGTVVRILPDDTQGLTHQCFVIETEAGERYEVNHSTTHGERIDGLRVGALLSVRGVVYRDKTKQGIHWTHHADCEGDAGWIEWNGRRYQ